MVDYAGRPGVSTLPRMPDYQRIMDDLRRRIASGEFPAGSKLPSQAALAAQYEVSVQPVKMALMLMELAGEVEGQQGKGTFVAGSPPDRDLGTEGPT